MHLKRAKVNTNSSSIKSIYYSKSPSKDTRI